MMLSIKVDSETSKVDNEVWGCTLGKFLCDCDQLNLTRILYDIMLRGLNPMDVLNAFRELTDKIEVFFAPLDNDVRESNAAVMVAVVFMLYTMLQ